MVNDPQELILKHLRAIRADQATMNRKLDTVQSNLLIVRKDINRLSGELCASRKAWRQLSPAT